MKESTLLSMRAVVDTQGTALRDVVLPGLRDVTVNERITRKRTDRVEDRLDALELFTLMGFWDRLRWLVTGRVPVIEAAPEIAYVPNVSAPHVSVTDPVEAECGCAATVN